MTCSTHGDIVGLRNMARQQTSCYRCEDIGWVCEHHPDYPWDGTCPCGGAGAPCPTCNCPAEGETPRMPDGFKVEIDKDGWRH